jgi:hypothetical protein
MTSSKLLNVLYNTTVYIHIYIYIHIHIYIQLFREGYHLTIVTGSNERVSTHTVYVDIMRSAL